MDIERAGGGRLAIKKGREIGIGHPFKQFALLGYLYFEPITVIKYRRTHGRDSGPEMALPDPGDVLRP
jgi:hypothetical protein